MPTAAHPQAKFDPIPPDLNLQELVDRTPNFDWVKRISAAQIRNIGQREFERLVLFHVVQGGKPLVIEKWNDRLPKSLFSAEWLEKTYDKKEENVRDITGQTDIPMTTGHYLRSMKQLTNQWTPTNFRDERRQRLYLKDIDCPPEWHERLRNIIPPNLFYFNDNVELKRRPQDNDLDMYDEDHITAPAGDLMSSLEPEMRAQNLMCYIGHEGTYTPAHREMCASLGQNIMVDASGDDHGEKVGSSIWFMTETKDREVVKEYFLSMLGHDIEIEKHFAQINAWKKATFPVYVVEQKVGDFILVPPLAPHQVWNRGTRTIKVAWNRTTVETLEMALHEALPKARLVCRDEQYKNKAIIYFSLQKYYKEMLDLQATAEMAWLGMGEDLFKDSPLVQQMVKDFKKLLALFTEILVDEMFATKEREVEYIEFDSNITCSYCRANIFNRFLTCKHCVRHLLNGDEDTYDVCMDCYAMGRSCLCISGLNWCEQWQWSELVDNYEAWRTMVIRNDGFVDMEQSPMPLEISRKKNNEKSIAQVCQEQLRRRPFKDITKIDEPASDPEPSEPEIDDEGRPKKKKRGRKKKKGDVHRCHVCAHKDYTYRLAFCSSPGCTEAYCFGALYRGFDQLPQAIMKNEHWVCPKCLGICNCGGCRRLKQPGKPYMPKNTFLGHDTRPIADDRSVEALVDFRVHNLGWLKKMGDDTRHVQSKRMQILQQAAQAEKAKDDALVNGIPTLPNADDLDAMDTAVQQSIANGDGDQADGGDGGDLEDYGLSALVERDNIQQQPVNGADASSAAVPDASQIEDDSLDPDLSSYPDPSTLGRDRIGMGYYEQDDSPDKILFDPYQAPSGETVVQDDPGMSEYVKKALRAAKRRAKQESDKDPDFEVRRSHHKKRVKLDKEARVDHQQEALNNMDPALFGQDVSVAEADERQEQSDTPEAVAPGATGESTENSVSQDQDVSRWFPANVPELRHSRPMKSYNELEDGGEEEFNETVVPKVPAPPPGITDFDPANVDKDPLDLASAAIQAIVHTGKEPVSSLAATPTAVKKRGRPPGRPRTSGAAAVATRKEVAKETSQPQPRPAGRRGRPPRLSGRPAKEASGSPETDSRNSPTDDDIGELIAQLDNDLQRSSGSAKDVSVDSPQVPGPKKRGRPPKNGPSKQTTPAQPKALSVELPSARPSAPPSATQFLSMKERMAFRGKKFKIGQKRSDAAVAGSAVSAPTIQSVSGRGKSTDKASTPAVTDKSASSQDSTRASTPSSEESASPIPAHQGTASVSKPAQPSGYTVVRLGDSESEADDYASGRDESDEASVTSSSDDEEDIPARKAPPATGARRGGITAVRGRGGRGGRGRPRGRRRGGRGF